ncbi:MAG: 3-phosphoshikimate 1-carboxyvinyltransferase, partial [Dehalococcoidia bacterium]
IKESDRLMATAKELSRLGANVEETTDGLRVTGGSKLSGATVRSYGDHRMAMTLGTAGLLSAGRTTVAAAESASVSYPSFWEELAAMGGGNAGK